MVVTIGMLKTAEHKRRQEGERGQKTSFRQHKKTKMI